MTGNREYKSDVFSMLLEDKARALDVYNALTGKTIRIWKSSRFGRWKKESRLRYGMTRRLLWTRI